MKPVFSVRAFVLNTITVLGGSPTGRDILEYATEHCPSLYDASSILKTLRDLRENGEIISGTDTGHFSKRPLNFGNVALANDTLLHRPQLFS